MDKGQHISATVYGVFASTLAVDAIAWWLTQSFGWVLATVWIYATVGLLVSSLLGLGSLAKSKKSVHQD